MKIYKNIYVLALLGMVFFIGCTDDIDAVLNSSDEFVSPVLTNPSSADPMVFTTENAPDLYEVFTWEKPQYGVAVQTNYVLEIDTAEDFSTATTLVTTSATSAEVLIADMNAIMLSLGLPAFEESSVFLRLRSTINGHALDTLYSNAIQRTATTFQDSECGNYCTIGLIGSATPGDWNFDTDMRLKDETKVDKSTWTVTVYLTGGKQVKFRANDDWVDNWGGTDFPAGTATLNGSDLTVAESGYYKVTFNDITAEYNFELLEAPVYATIGLLGDATPGGWETDGDLTQDATDPHLWTGTFTLTDGEVKFRGEDDWVDSWGNTTFPSGYGIPGGPNIPVTAGTYFVRFNDVTGAYSFAPSESEPFTSVGIIGDATAGGWAEDTDLIQNPTNPYLWSSLVTITDGEAKFRADDDWADDWGGSTFPGGIAKYKGPNIPVEGGTYFLTFNTGTGEYYFLK